MIWIKKTFKNENEIFNLNYLLALAPDIIPTIEIKSESTYLVEKCSTIDFEDIKPENFSLIYDSLFLRLYTFKRQKFTKGVYKYFEYYGLNSESTNETYIFGLMNSLNTYLDIFYKIYPELCGEQIFIDLVNKVREESKNYTNWVPHDGYSLLHGDLHVGNIVKKNNKYLFIDFEYLQYGRPEIEIANLIISSLIWNYEKNKNKNKIEELVISYIEVCSNLPSFDKSLFRFFFYYVQLLFCFRSIVKKESLTLNIILEIFQLRIF